MFRTQPYLSTDSFGSLLVSVTNTTSCVVVKASLDDGTEIIVEARIDVEENVVEVPFSLAKIVPKLKAYDVKISFYDTLVHVTSSKLYHLPAGPRAVKIDRLYGGIFTSTNETIFPIGPYVDVGGWLAKGDIRANLQTLKDLNYNIINPDPPYPNISFIHQMFQAADMIGGIYIQYSFRHDYTDTQKADEPDGEQWTNVSDVFEAHEAIKSVDPYHPTSLVLNCQHSAAFYADSVDILSTDQITVLSKKIKELSNYMLTTPKLPPSHIIISSNLDIHAGGWISENKNTLLLIVVNSNKGPITNFSITIKDLLPFGLLHGVGEIDSEKESHVFIENGIFESNLKERELETRSTE
ncbi:15900_t:CDS:2 [Acaulospora colombiana]|uniref:15900_t:CDS:1 n=1 Tax=Acaulospora colombiana TaxID=27376 RepID=A0ACA9KFP0_9GLOM|nr:15900_t:CDS:2 [Acaulospora colombiana]